MNDIKTEIISACENAAKHSLADLGESLLRWWPAAYTADFRNMFSERMKSEVEGNLDRLLKTDLLGTSVLEARNVLGTGATFSGSVTRLATGDAAPGSLAQLSADQRVVLPPLRANQLTATFIANVHVSSELHSQDRQWHTNASVKLTLNIDWASG